MARIHCYNCKNLWDFDPPLPRSEECPKCHRDAKVCLNCQHYDAQAYRECREPQATWVKEKDRSNFCSYFSASEIAKVEGRKNEDTKKALDDLFKK